MTGEEKEHPGRPMPKQRGTKGGSLATEGGGDRVVGNHRKITARRRGRKGSNEGNS